MKEIIFLLFLASIASLYITFNLRENHQYYNVVEKNDLPIDFFHQHNHPKGYTIRKLKLCDQKRSIHYNDLWKCEQDVTCVKCQKHSIQRHEALLTAFEKFKDVRREEFKKYKKDEPIILMTMNSGYEKILRNLMCSFEMNNINILRNMYLIPCEPEMVKILEEINLPHTKANSWMEEFHIMTKFQGTNVSK